MGLYKSIFLGVLTWFALSLEVNAQSNFDAGVLTIPGVQVENERYSVNLNLTDANTLTFQVDFSSLVNITSITTESGTNAKFDAGRLTIQQVKVGQDTFFAILNLIDATTLIFQVDLNSLVNITQPLATTLTQQAYIKSSNTGKNDLLRAIAIDGDTLVVGASGETGLSSGVNGDQSRGHPSKDRASGAAYVFIRKSGVWTQQAYIKASNRESPDRFGFSVDISGDTIVVSAPSENSGVTGDQLDNSVLGSGAAYIFTRNNNVWTQQAYIKAPNPDKLDFFGGSVSLDVDTLVVGAKMEDSLFSDDVLDNSGNNSGAAYVYTRTGTSWSKQGYLKASNADNSAFFGDSVDVSGDTIVVGSPQENRGGHGVNADENDTATNFHSGAAYVFIRNAGVWSQQAYLKASNAGHSDEFGMSVTIFGDTVAVGAPGEGSGAIGINGAQESNSPGDTGAVYVFTRNTGSWGQQAYIKASNTDFNDGFGMSISLSGNTLVVGAPREGSASTGVNGEQLDNSISSSGAAYSFTRSGDRWKQQAYLKASNPDKDDSFGERETVAVSGDTIVISAPFEKSASIGINGDQLDNSAINSGAVYVFK